MDLDLNFSANGLGRSANGLGRRDQIPLLRGNCKGTTEEDAATIFRLSAFPSATAAALPPLQRVNGIMIPNSHRRDGL